VHGVLQLSGTLHTGAVPVRRLDIAVTGLGVQPDQFALEMTQLCELALYEGIVVVFHQ
jgi:hypothetical protein